MDMVLDVAGDPRTEAFAEAASRRADDLLDQARARGGRVCDPADFLARALDGIYMRADASSVGDAGGAGDGGGD